MLRLRGAGGELDRIRERAAVVRAVDAGHRAEASHHRNHLKVGGGGGGWGLEHQESETAKMHTDESQLDRFGRTRPMSPCKESAHIAAQGFVTRAIPPLPMMRTLYPNSRKRPCLSHDGGMASRPWCVRDCTFRVGNVLGSFARFEREAWPHKHRGVAAWQVFHIAPSESIGEGKALKSDLAPSPVPSILANLIGEYMHRCALFADSCGDTE